MIYSESWHTEVEEVIEEPYESSYVTVLSSWLRSTLPSTTEPLWCETWSIESPFRRLLHHESDETSILSMTSVMRLP